MTRLEQGEGMVRRGKTQKGGKLIVKGLHGMVGFRDSL